MKMHLMYVKKLLLLVKPAGILNTRLLVVRIQVSFEHKVISG